MEFSTVEAAAAAYGDSLPAHSWKSRDRRTFEERAESAARKLPTDSSSEQSAEAVYQRGIRFRHTARAVCREAHGNVYVLPPSGHDIIVLSGAGNAIWHAFAEPKTVDEVVTSLMSTYDAAADIVTMDVRSVVGDLADRGLLVPA